jgi:hypothetical protein
MEAEKMTRTKMIWMIVILSMCFACAGTEAQKRSSNPGEKAYDFSLSDQNGKIIKLSEVLKDYRGAVIAFYPKDNTKN